MSGRAITPELVPFVFELAGKGMRSEQIAGELAARGVHATARTVRRVLEKERHARAELARTIVTEELKGSLVKDLVGLDSQITAVQAEAAARLKEKDYDAHLRSLDRYAKLLDLKLHYSGAGPAAEAPRPARQVHDSLMAKLGARLERLKPAAEPPAALPVTTLQ